MPAPLQSSPLTRRDFLKAGCAACAGLGAATCALSLAAIRPGTSETQLPVLSLGEANMNPRILVAYGSAMGSTAEIAIEIGKTISASGCAVDVRPVKRSNRCLQKSG
jgi:hypothetical protein